MESVKEKVKISITAEDNVIKTMFWQLLPAQIFATAVSSLGSIISGLLVGNGLSESALAALGFVVPLNNMVAALSTIVYGGARIICGESMGRGDKDNQKKIFSSAIWILLGLGLLLTLGEFAFSKGMSELLGASGNVLEPTSLYIKGIALGVIPTLLIPCLMVFLQLGNDSNYALISTIVLAGLSLIFGVINLKALRGGIFGMGIADALSKWITLGIMILRFIKKKHQKLAKEMLPKSEIIRMIVLGFPTALSAILYAFRNSVLNSFALKSFGDEVVAALAIFNSSIGIFDAVNIGVGTVCLTLLSLYLGMNDKEGVKKVINVCIKIGLILALAKLIILFALGGPIAELFGAEGSLRETTSMLYNLYGLCMPLNIVTLAFVSFYQCTGNVKLVTIFYILNAVLLPIGFAWIAMPLIGIVGLYLCFAVAELLSLIMFYIIGLSKGKKSIKVPNMIEIPDDKGDYINFSVKNLRQVSEVSRILIEFCEAKGIDHRRSYFCGLCAEEIAGNSVEHGFANSAKKNLSVDIYVHILKDNIQLRICDNCVEFNPLELLAAKDNDNPAENMGIKLVQKLSDEFTYQSTFGQNIISVVWNA